MEVEYLAPWHWIRECCKHSKMFILQLSLDLVTCVIVQLAQFADVLLVHAV